MRQGYRTLSFGGTSRPRKDLRCIVSETLSNPIFLVFGTSEAFFGHRLAVMIIYAALCLGYRPCCIKPLVKFLCRHCDQSITGRPYRVLSEENGVTFLDLIVCDSCHQEAKELGLRAEEFKSTKSRARARRPQIIPVPV